jgi:hypothetical protein
MDDTVRETIATSDRLISSLAIVKVNFDRGRSFLENFSPFLRHCLDGSKETAVSAPELQQQIESEFGLNLPLAVIKTLLRREEREGHVKRSHGTLWVESEALDDANLEADRADAQRKQRALITSIIDFAAKSECRWSETHTKTLLMEYLDAFSTSLVAAAVGGKSIPSGDGHRWIGDQYVVHKFVLHASRADPDSFGFLEMVVKGKMLADAIYMGKEDVAENETPLSKLEVYLDGPILLHLLGYAGPELAAPYLELVELLKKQGANPRCFSESLEEARTILDAASEKVRTGGNRVRFHGDVVAYLVRMGKSRSDIKLLASRLEVNLQNLGVQMADQPPAISRLTTDEARFEEILRERINYSNPIAMTTDLDALTAIHRLRNGQAAKSLGNSKAVFVTRNADLVRASARFFEQRQLGHRIPNCMHDSTFTTMVWLNQPLAAPDLPRERIIADAFAAMNPSHRLWQAFLQEIEDLRNAEDISVEEADILRMATEAKQALMDETLGDDDAYTDGTAKQVLERALENIRADGEAKLTAEQTARTEAETRLSNQSLVIAKRAKGAGRIGARLIFGALIPVLAAGLIFGPLGPLEGGWSPLPGFLQVLCTGIVIAVSAWSLWEGASLRKLAQRTARLIERGTERLLRSLTSQKSLSAPIGAGDQQAQL